MRPQYSAAATALLLTLAIPSTPGRCQTPLAAPSALTPQVSSLGRASDAFTGPGVPTTLTLGDLATPGQSWTRFRRSSLYSNALNSYLELISTYAQQGGGDDHYYTQGHQVTIGSTPYLIAYTLPSAPINYADLIRMQRSNTPPSPMPLTPDTKLTLSLLNVQTLPGLIDVEALNLQEVTSESNNQIAAASQPSPEDIQTTALSNARQLMLGVIMYVQDNKKYPKIAGAADFKKAIYPYIKSNQVFNDPETNTPFLVNTSLSGRAPAAFKHPETMVYLYSAKPNALGNRIVGFLDGHAKILTESQYQTLAAASHIR